MHKGADNLIQGVKSVARTRVQQVVHSLADLIHQLNGHCNVSMVNDALRDWHDSLEDNSDAVSTLSEQNAGVLCHRVEQHVLCVEVQVEPFIASQPHTEDWLVRLEELLKNMLSSLEAVVVIFKKALNFVLLKEDSHLMREKVPIGFKGYKNRRDIVFSQAVTAAVTSFVSCVVQSVTVSSFLSQLMGVGFLIHWESLLSTYGDEMGMLEDFITAIHDLNTLKFKMVLSKDINEIPKINGSRYKVVVEVPVQKTLFQMLPSQLQNGKEISVCVVLFTQGVSEKQSLADESGDNTLQDQINMQALQAPTSYCTRYREHFGSTDAILTTKVQKTFSLLEQLQAEVHARKAKNIDILFLSQELCRTVDCARVTSCKGAKDRTAMSVTLEQAHILMREMHMDTSCFQHAIDAMRRYKGKLTIKQGTRIQNTEKCTGVSLYEFSAEHVPMFPPLYRPPEGTYGKLQT